MLPDYNPHLKKQKTIFKLFFRSSAFFLSSIQQSTKTESQNFGEESKESEVMKKQTKKLQTLITPQPGVRLQIFWRLLHLESTQHPNIVVCVLLWGCPLYHSVVVASGFSAWLMFTVFLSSQTGRSAKTCSLMQLQVQCQEKCSCSFIQGRKMHKNPRLFAPFI